MQSSRTQNRPHHCGIVTGPGWRPFGTFAWSVAAASTLLLAVACGQGPETAAPLGDSHAEVSGGEPADEAVQRVRARIEAEVPQLADPRLDDWARINLIRQWAYYTTDLAATEQSLLPFHSTMSQQSVETILNALDANEGGLWCAGTAWVMAKALEAFGFEDYTIFHYGFRDERLITHTVVLIPITHRGHEILSIQDPYFNLAYLDRHGAPLDYFALLQHLQQRAMNAIDIQDDAGERAKDVIVHSTAETYSIKRGIRVSFADVAADATCERVGDLHICRAAPTITGFVETHDMVGDTQAELSRRGLPTDLRFLFMFPYGIFDSNRGGYVHSTEPHPFFCAVSRTLNRPLDPGCAAHEG